MTARALHNRGHDAGARDAPIDRLSPARAAMLHLVPGVLTIVVFIVVASLFRGRAIPPQLALLVAILAVGVPFQLGYLRWW